MDNETIQYIKNFKAMLLVYFTACIAHSASASNDELQGYTL